MRGGKGGGHSLKEIKAAGYSCAEAKAAGHPLQEMEVATPRDAKAAGYSLEEMKDAGYEWRWLVTDLRVTYDELIQLGYTGIALRSRSASK